MLGLMQDWPLLVSKLIEHAELNHGRREVVGMLPEGGKIRTDLAAVGKRSRKVAEALLKLGIKEGDRVATLAWNSHRHMESWFGISGMGAVCHTVNPRLFEDQIIYILNHAEDRVLFYDITFAPLVAKVRPHLTTIEHYVQYTSAEHLGDVVEGALAYEELVEAEAGTYEWPNLDENTACGLCYTSGTTGNPKGVLYSHRSNFLHTLMALAGDTLGISATSSILPVVPMFHANAWGIPYAVAAAGAKIVFNGPHHDPETLHQLVIDEDVTVTAAVPTVWLAMLGYLEETGKDLGKLDMVTIGGSAAPRTMIEAFQTKYGVRVNHAWGMTETSPLGSLGSENGLIAHLSEEEKLDIQCKQGRPVPGVEMKILDEDGNEQPRDGESSGRLMVRGPWVTKEYYRGEGGNVLEDGGWFDTGDVACFDENGYMQITDRAKDVIKSGGEWISSIDLENAAVSYPGVTEAAVIGIFHPKWNERPLLILTVNEGVTITLEEMQGHLADKIAKWWQPDAVEIVTDIPHTATGKISKKDLRVQFKDYTLPA